MISLAHYVNIPHGRRGAATAVTPSPLRGGASLVFVRPLTPISLHHIKVIDRDRGTPHGAAPPTPPGIRVTYHGGSIGLSVCRNIESGETK